MKTIASTGKSCPPPYILNSEKMSESELQGVYNEIAPNYDKKIWFDQYVLGIARQRRRLMSQARGKILDVACGTGSNFPVLPATGEITAIDLSPAMLELAQNKATALSLKVQTKVMNAQQLEFSDESFNTVISTLSTCTFPDPIQALQEMKRVCRTGGLILLLEHGHSSLPWLANFQDRNVLPHYQQNAGCRWNQDPLELITTAGLKSLSSIRFGLGMFHAITATP